MEYDRIVVNERFVRVEEYDIRFLPRCRGLQILGE